MNTSTYHQYAESIITIIAGNAAENGINHLTGSRRRRPPSFAATGRIMERYIRAMRRIVQEYNKKRWCHNRQQRPLASLQVQHGMEMERMRFGGMILSRIRASPWILEEEKRRRRFSAIFIFLFSSLPCLLPPPPPPPRFSSAASFSQHAAMPCRRRRLPAFSW